MTKINSAYVVHSQVIGINDKPFVPAGKIRPLWDFHFCSPKYLDNLPHTICNPPYASISYPAFPFIPGYGSFYMHSHMFRLLGNRARHELMCLVGGKPYQQHYNIHLKKRFGPRAGRFQEADIEDVHLPVFGYDQSLEDQRMNFLFFEGCRPLHIQARPEKDLSAHGKIFLHLHPCGYMVVYSAIALNWSYSPTVEQLMHAIIESRPWRDKNDWHWTSRLTNGPLSNLIDLLKVNMQKAIFSDGRSKLREGSWHSAIKIVSTIRKEELLDKILMTNDKFDILAIQRESDVHYAGARYLISSPKGLVCNFYSDKMHNRNRLRFFWKILTLHEFLLLKEQIYSDYSNFFSTEIPKLKDFRMSTKRKITKEDIKKLSVYDSKITHFIPALDRHIYGASPFHRMIYSSLSKGMAFDKQREHLIKQLRDWEKEIEQWQHPFIAVWKKVLTPLRTLIPTGGS